MLFDDYKKVVDKFFCKAASRGDTILTTPVHSPSFTYMKQPPRRWTFENKRLKTWVESYCTGRCLNLFSGHVRLNINELRIDIDESADADYHMDALDFVKWWKKIGGGLFDTVILDAPYGWRKAKELYNGHYIGSFPRLKTELNRIIAPSGRVITLGYDSVGMSAQRGFKKIAICLVCHSGDHKDTIGLVEERVHGGLVY